jgi:exodeoxyribonuclease V alpha subunit
LAYAITVHKSQGSEYEIVIMPFVGSFSVMLQRNLLYTAVTRAKKKVFIMGEWGAVRRAVANARVSDRNTQLSSRIVAAAV